MLWLCVTFPQLSLEAFQPSPSVPIAVVEKKSNRRWIRSCTQAACDLGVSPGFDAVSAAALAPQLQLLGRSLPRERELLRTLAGWAGQFSSHVSLDHHRQLLWLEIGGSLRFFGGLDALLMRVRDGLTELGHSHQLGVAPTREAAALSASIGDLPAVESGQSVLSAISSVALGHLCIPDAGKLGMHGSGLRTIGDVYRLPFNALARRFGQGITDYLRRLTGDLSDIRPAFRAPTIYSRKLQLLAHIETVEGLQFPLRRLLLELQGSLRARDAGLQELTLTLVHEDKADTVLRIRTTRPQRDAGQLLVLLREQLSVTALPCPVTDLVLGVDAFVPYGDTQLDLFDKGRRRDSEWQALLDKLRARLGEQAVRKLGLRSDHRPEKAWCIADGATAGESITAERPLWLLESPKPLQQLPRLSSQPERIESGWWDGDEVCRDYFVATTPTGSRLWLYREANNRKWYLHGIWS